MLVVGFNKRTIAPRNPVPAIDAWIPALPINDNIAVTSSNAKPAPLATGPTNLKAWPNCTKSVLAEVKALTRMSLVAPISSTDRPYPVRMFVVISAADAKSIEAAVAN